MFYREPSTKNPAPEKTMPKPKRKFSSRQKALLLAKSALEKKAKKIIILDVKKLVFYTDFIVICHGTSHIHNKTIIEDVLEKTNKFSIKESHIEGYPDSDWMLIDYGDVILHVFSKEKREFYQLEKLWGDARKVSFKSKEPQRTPSKK
jgi:ribosome-associated protein